VPDFESTFVCFGILYKEKKKKKESEGEEG
jgi:hypothetical protein